MRIFLSIAFFYVALLATSCSQSSSNRGGSVPMADDAKQSSDCDLSFPSRTFQRQFFGCERWELPFTESIGAKGRIFTFESQFQGNSSGDSRLAKDVKLLLQLKLDECSYGAASCPVHPFICELRTERTPLTGADVLAALKPRDFRSQHIRKLESTSISFPGYHPHTDNDEIHNDFEQQYIFRHKDEDNEKSDEFGGAHGVLKRYVERGQLWYVLLHTGRRGHSRWVVLFAVGCSPHGKKLVGVVTHQVCHNLCD